MTALGASRVFVLACAEKSSWRMLGGASVRGFQVLAYSAWRAVRGVSASCVRRRQRIPSL
jgi:hypothetical protein